MTSRVLITRGSADGGWAEQVAQGLYAADSTVRSFTVKTNNYNPTQLAAGCNNAIVDLTGTPAFPVPGAVSSADYRALQGILSPGGALPGFLAPTYRACLQEMLRYTHLAIPPTGAETLPMAMHQYPVTWLKKHRNLVERAGGVPPDSFAKVDLGAPDQASMEPLIKFDVSQYQRTLMIEIGLIAAAYHSRIPIYATCHGAQLLWYLLGGGLRRIPRTKELGWRVLPRAATLGANVIVSGGMMKIRSFRRTTLGTTAKTPYFHSALSDSRVERTASGALEFSAGAPRIERSDTSLPITNRQINRVAASIEFYDFEHASYMLGPIQGVRSQPHPMVSLAGGAPRPIGSLQADAPNMVGAYQMESVFGFQYHPHKVVTSDPKARLFFQEWLRMRAHHKIAWL